MNALFVIIFLLSGLSLIAFLVLTIFNFTKQNKVKGSKTLKYTGVSLLTLIISLIGFGVTMDDSETADKDNKQKVEVGAKREESELGEDDNKAHMSKGDINNELTVDAYAERVAGVFKEMRANTNLKILSVLEQEGDSTNIRLSNDTIITVYTKGDIVNQLTLHMSPEAFYEGNADFKFAYLLLIGTTDNTLSMGKRNLILRELSLDDNKIFKKKYKSNTTVGAITYSYEGNKKDGYSLTSKW